MHVMAQTPSEVGRLAYSYGRKKKRNNAVVALLSGAVPGIFLAFYFPLKWHLWLIGLLIGLVWGNAFEYAYHRWLLHRPHCPLARGHSQHHANLGTPECFWQADLAPPWPSDLAPPDVITSFTLTNRTASAIRAKAGMECRGRDGALNPFLGSAL